MSGGQGGLQYMIVMVVHVRRPSNLAQIKTQSVPIRLSIDHTDCQKYIINRGTECTKYNNCIFVNITHFNF